MAFNKKMINMLILDILKEHTDENHHLSQQDIIRLLKIEYDTDCDRRTVKNNILYLIEYGYEIGMDDGYYLIGRDLDDAQLKLLIDSVLFNTNLTQIQSHDLIESLKKQGNRYFKDKVRETVSLVNLQHGENRQLMQVFDKLSEAIVSNRKISFIYNDYGTDLKLHPRREKPYIADPYEIAVNYSWFYLLCTCEGYEDIAHFRLDRMTKVKILEDKTEERNIDLAKHMKEHIYMYSGESVFARFTTPVNDINEIVDWLGKDLNIADIGDERIEVSLRCNRQALFYWALQYGTDVEILEPYDLRDEIRETVRRMNNKYECQ